MIVVYTQKIENAILMAACTGNISFKGRIIQPKELDNLLEEMKESFSKTGYLESSVNDSPALFTWGENLFERCSFDSYNEEQPDLDNEQDIFFPNSVRYKAKEESQRNVEVLCGLFAAKKHDLIYDASIGTEEEGTFRILCEMSGAADKIIRKINVHNLSTAGIREAFNKPLEGGISKSKMAAGQIKDYCNFVGDANICLGLSPLISEENAFSLYSVPLLSSMVRRDADSEKNTKVSFEVKGQFELYGKEFTVSSTDTTFASQKKARIFIDSLSETLKVTDVETKIIEDYPPGPHNTASILKAANQILGYDETEVMESLDRLFKEGYISQPKTKSRYYEIGSEETVKAIMKRLSASARYNNYLKDIENMQAAAYFYKAESETGIIVSGKMPTNAMPQIDKNLFIMICNEMVKTFYPTRKFKETVIRIGITDNVFFSTSSRSVIEKGYTVLQKNNEEPVNHLESIKEGQILQMTYTVEAKTVEQIIPATETELIKEFSSNAAYTPEIIRTQIQNLLNGGFCVKKDNRYIPTLDGKKIINTLSDLEDILSGQSLHKWQTEIKQMAEMKDFECAAEIGNSLLLQFKTVIATLRETLSNQLGHESHLICPTCNIPMLETSSKFFCQSCSWALQKTQYGRTFNEKELYVLLKNRTTPVIPGFIKGKKDVRGRIYLNDKNEIRFTENSIHTCPACKGNLRVTKSGDGYYCPDKDCQFTLRFNYFGHDLTREETTKLLTEHRTHVITSLESSDGIFSGCLYIDSMDGYKIKCLKIK